MESPWWACGAHSKCPDGSPCSHCVQGEPHRGRGRRSTQKLLGAIKAPRPPSPCFCFQNPAAPNITVTESKGKEAFESL